MDLDVVVALHHPRIRLGKTPEVPPKTMKVCNVAKANGEMSHGAESIVPVQLISWTKPRPACLATPKPDRLQRSHLWLSPNTFNSQNALGKARYTFSIIGQLILPDQSTILVAYSSRYLWYTLFCGGSQPGNSWKHHPDEQSGLTLRNIGTPGPETSPVIFQIVSWAEQLPIPTWKLPRTHFDVFGRCGISPASLLCTVTQKLWWSPYDLAISRCL